MKRIILFIRRRFTSVGIITLLLAIALTNSQAQDTWTQKADFGGLGRHTAAGFSIGNKGYIGTGYNGSYKSDFWEYDSTTDVWMQKADFGGAARAWATGFSIGSKGFIGAGFSYDGSSHYYKDFWEYDPNLNVWIQKPDYGGIGGAGATGFSIGSKGYMGIGNLTNAFWEFDPSLNTWTQKADFGGTGRDYAVSFSIGTKGYIGTGYGGETSGFKNDFWEYDPAFDTWSQKANFEGTKRYAACGFSIAGKGYIGMGVDSAFTGKNDFWEFDPFLNMWTRKADYGGAPISNGVGFSIGGRGYIGGTDQNDFWEYTPCGNGSNVYTDADGDDYGNVDSSIFVTDCVAPNGYVKNNTDCNDANASIHPGVCDASNGNGIDDNCDGIIDDGNGTIPYYTDADGDGYGIGSATSLCTNPGTGYSTNNLDCNDANALINPGVAEVLNGIDDNCNGIIDENACPWPVNPSVSNITATSVTLNWDVVAGSVGYKIRYKVSTTGAWSHRGTSFTSIPLYELSSGTQYTWQLRNICASNPIVSSDWSAKQKFVTPALRMVDELSQQASFQIYPNPVADHATIQFTLNLQSPVQISVYDMSGREMETWMDKDVEQGAYSLQITTNQFSKGVYFVKMITDFGISNQKLIVQ